MGIRALGLNAISSLPVIGQAGAPSGASVLPHFAVGDSFVTDLYVVNSNNTAANFTISFYDDTGTRVNAVTNITDSVGAHGVKFYELGSPMGPGAAGSATVTSDAGITVQALFRRLGSDFSYYEAAVPMSIGGTDFSIPFDATTFTGNGGQIFTGVALANLDLTHPANVACTAQDSVGNTIPNAVTVPPLTGRGHWANYLFPLLVGKVGTLHCTSDSAVGAMGIRALGLNTISSLPVIGISNR